MAPGLSESPHFKNNSNSYFTIIEYGGQSLFAEPIRTGNGVRRSAELSNFHFVISFYIKDYP